MSDADLGLGLHVTATREFDTTAGIDLQHIVATAGGVSVGVIAETAEGLLYANAMGQFLGRAADFPDAMRAIHRVYAEWRHREYRRLRADHQPHRPKRHHHRRKQGETA